MTYVDPLPQSCSPAAHGATTAAATVPFYAAYAPATNAQGVPPQAGESFDPCQVCGEEHDPLGSENVVVFCEGPGCKVGMGTWGAVGYRVWGFLEGWDRDGTRYEAFSWTRHDRDSKHPPPPKSPMSQVAVHPGCYGFTIIPEGEWKCDACVLGQCSRTAECLLCPVAGGAFKVGGCAAPLPMKCRSISTSTVTSSGVAPHPTPILDTTAGPRSLATLHEGEDHKLGPRFVCSVHPRAAVAAGGRSQRQAWRCQGGEPHHIFPITVHNWSLNATPITA